MSHEDGVIATNDDASNCKRFVKLKLNEDELVVVVIC